MKFHYILIMSLFVALESCKVSGKTDDTAMKPPVIPVITLAEKDTLLFDQYVADIQAYQNVEIRAKAPGFLDKILVDEGAEVKKGQTLFLINDEEYQVELSRAKATLSSTMAEAKAAELEVKRVKTLVEKNVISKTELELAEAKLKAAEAKVSEARSAEENARLKLSYTSIKAPFSGIINRIPFKLGSLISEGALLTTVSDVQTVYAYFNVSESEYLHYIKSKQHNKATHSDSVKLILADGSRYLQDGLIETVEGEIDESTGSIAFRAKFSNPHKLLKHGSSGKVELNASANKVIMIPQKAVMEIQDKNFVFVLNQDNTVKMKSFVPRTRIDNYYIVKTGLSTGDKIVYEGIQSVSDGTAITPKEVSGM
ncbi:efflux RND transporter periplasmic adaptor subunit [Danxiaibacter flavus]|uniref:Efflux RND transporter periplasmic adaptor subunit n=1 Tax=Danxiaibacter flavus TaxID=3049108 RepID=A0ABV3ZMJ5_9BACT|nr:efflux RND transporter periplasmic adaptor subunit [Chitinophagaceae bacterium DXS]